MEETDACDDASDAWCGGTCGADAAGAPRRNGRPSRSTSSCRSRPAAPPTCSGACWRSTCRRISASRSSWRTARARAAISAPALVAKAAPDGYTFLVGTVSTHAINPFLYSKLPLRHREGFPAGQPDRAAAEPPGGASEPAGEERRGADRLPESQSRQAVLRLVGRRHLDPSRRRAVQDQDRHHDDPCAVPLLRRHHEQPDRRPHQSRLRQRHARLAAGAGRPAARARGLVDRARADSRPTCRRSPTPSRASRRPPGMACSRRPGRRNRSSTRWRPR